MPSEVQIKLTDSITSLIELFSVECDDERTKNTLITFQEQNFTPELLNSAENYAKSQPYFNYERAINMISEIWNNYYDCLTADRKNYLKRLKVMKEDRKADPEVVKKLEASIKLVEEKKAVALVNITRLKLLMNVISSST